MFHVWIAQSVRDLCICEYARGRHDDVAHWQEIGRSARLAKDIRQLQFSRSLFDFDDAITLRFTHANDFRADVRQALMGSVFDDDVCDHLCIAEDLGGSIVLGIILVDHVMELGSRDTL